MKACVNCEGRGDDCFDPREEPGAEARDQARPPAAGARTTIIQRVIQFARQGYTEHRSSTTYDTDWESEAYLTVSGQNSNNSVRVTDDFLRAVETRRRLEAHRAAPTGKVAEDAEGAATCGRRSATPPGPPPIPACSSTPPSTTGTPARRSGAIRASNPCSEYMFLDDTACNLASLNLLQFRDATTARSTSRRYEHAVRLWTVVLEISVLMAQFPSREIAELLLRLPHARPRLRQYRRPADDVAACPTIRPTAARICGALTAIMTGVAYATSAEMAGELGAFPGYAGNRDAHAARHPQPPPRRPWRGVRLRGPRTDPGAARPSTSPLGEPAPRCARRAGRLGRGAGARREARLPQRPGDGDRADRHDRPGHGLRHHRHRARLRAGEVQEAGRRRLLQDHQPRRARGAAHARLRRGRRSPRSRPMRSATARSPRRPAINHDDAGRRASPTRRSRRSRRHLDVRLRHQVRLQQVDARARTSARRAQGPGRAARRSGFELLPLPRLLQGRDRGRQHPCLRRDDARGRAASSRPSTTRCSIAPTRAAGSASATSRSRATSA